MINVKDYHIHLYFNEETLAVAREVASNMKLLYPSIEIGRFHEKAVGPHPRFSVQLLIRKEDYNEALNWVSFNRKGLTVFAHPNTGNDLLDHTDYAIWMGELLELNLKAL